jgi:hypothetical protein
MKDRSCTTPVMTYPNFKLPFILTTDASKVAIGAIFSQVQHGQERPIGYASRQLNTAEQNYTVSEQELLALVWATRYFRYYLFGTRFVVRTDHAALTSLQTSARRQHQLVVPQTLVQDVIKENHDPKYVAHPGIKRTYSLISVNYWGPRMKETIEGT